MSESEKDKLLQMKSTALDIFQKMRKDMMASIVPRFQEFNEEYKKRPNANLNVLIEITCQIQANTYLLKYMGIAIDKLDKAKSVDEFYRALFITIDKIEKA